MSYNYNAFKLMALFTIVKCSTPSMYDELELDTLYTSDTRQYIIEIRGTASAQSPGKAYNITKCNPTIFEAEDDKIQDIQTYGNCFNIYSETGCTGLSVRYRAGRLLTELNKLNKHRWDGDIHVQDEHLQVKSVGPCLDKCDPRNWEGATSAPVTVTMYDDEDFSGDEITVVLDGDRCYPISSGPTATKASIKISGDESSCVELHDNPSCGGAFTQLRQGYPYLHDLWFWGIAGNDIAVYAMAVSRCGAFCNKTAPDINPTMEPHSEDGIVTLYAHEGYYGLSFNLNLTDGTCQTLPSTRRTGSIRTYGQCVILYEESDCSGQNPSRSLQTSGKDVDYYVEKILTHTLPLPMTTKSIRLCDKKIAGGTSSTPQQEPENTSKPEVAQLECTKQQLEIMSNKSSFPVWAIFCIIFAELILICLFALGGVYIFKRYNGMYYNRNGEQYNVSYQLHS